MSGFTVILVKKHFLNKYTAGIVEAAEIDGAGQVSIFFKIVFPLSTPILATVELMAAVTYWNDWQNGLSCSATISCTASSSFLMK